MTSEKRRFAFRVDASAAMGTGHVMRCLTLADTLRERGAQTRFVCRHLPAHLKNCLLLAGHEVRQLAPVAAGSNDQEPTHSSWLGVPQAQDVRDSLDALSDQIWDWVVVDHYALDIEWESGVAVVAKNIMVIDDMADRQHDCQVLLDQNFYLHQGDRYAGKVMPSTRLLLGPRFALLRKEFSGLRQTSLARQGTVRRILVFFGGADALNYTARALKVLERFPLRGTEVDVVIGELHPQKVAIEEECARQGFQLHVQTSQMAKLMAAADLCLGAGGGATWERCCLGLPTIAVSMAVNQDRQIADAAAAGLLLKCETKGQIESAIEAQLRVFLDASYILRKISMNGMKAVDGLGASRIADALFFGDVEVAVATPDSSRQIFEWRNHASIRSVSRTTELISWKEHQSWFEKTIEDPGRVLLLGLRDGVPIGVVRFDLEAESADISIYVAPELNQSGVGQQLLAAAERWLAENRSNLSWLRAVILGSNERSLRLFVRAGYQLESTHYKKRLH